MGFAEPATMLRRLLPAAASILAFLSVGANASGANANAAGAWVGSAGLEPIEQRIAVAVGPERTTIWTSLRFEQSSAGPMAIVVPAPEGAALDFSSDAWFEALEVATAPRIFSPPGTSPSCPGVSGPSSLFEIIGNTDHTQSLPIDDLSVLDDVPALSTWVSQSGLALSADLSATLESMSGMRFVALRFQAPSGTSLTPTLRVTMPAAPSTLPLALTRAGTQNLRVVSWVFGAGRASLEGAGEIAIPNVNLSWDAAAKTSNYEDERDTMLSSAGNTAMIVECANHEALSHNLSIANGTATIDGVVTTFFERASAYGDAAADPSTCIAQAAVALSSSGLLSPSCPRADLGIVGAGSPCVEAPLPGTLDPAKLRCGGIADDLAVALSSLVPGDAWLNRQMLSIEAGQSGVDWPVSFSLAAEVSPVRHTSSVDLSDCTSGSGSTGSGTTGSGPSSGAGATIDIPVGSGSTGSGSGTGSGAGGYDGGYVDYGYVDTGCSCSGTGDSYYNDGDSCSGDSSGYDGDSCSGDSGSYDGDSCSGDSGSYDGDTCSGDSSYDGDSCDGGSYDGDSCDAGSSDVDCSSSPDAGDCSIHARRGARRRGPKVSAVSFALLALVFPLRRRGRRSRASAR